MLKLTAWFMFGVFTQLIAIIMWGEYVWLYRFANGGVGGTPLESVQPIFWLLLLIEIVVFLLFVVMVKRKAEISKHVKQIADRVKEKGAKQV
ncbi:putative membrane protein [Sporosarcina luteola]|nr:putative membrane protein [Sporosarcina luteola]